MLKLGKHRNSGGDLDVLLRVSSHANLLRHIMHTLLCIAALVLGFSISREAVLIVVSFRLPYGSLFVKTMTHTNGHEVAIISFPRMKQSQAFAESFSASHLTKDQTEKGVPHTEELSLSTLGGNGQVHTFSESKIVVQEHGSSSQSRRLESAQSSSRVHVGRHEILIRPWPYPEPLHTVSAHQLISLVQEEQQQLYGAQQRKQILVITPTFAETFQVAGLTSLIHTLRLIRRPLLWIVVEAGNASNETATLLANSGLSFHHLSFQDASTNLKACLWTEGLRYVHAHRLKGIVVFADESITYNLNFFDEVQRVKLIGAFAAGSPPFLDIQRHNNAACEDAQGLRTLIFRLTNMSNSLANPPASGSSSSHGVCWYSSTRNESSAGNASPIGSLNWSAFVFDASLLWRDHKVSWIKSWRELFVGNQTVLQSPLDLVKNSSQIEPLGSCGCLAL